MTNRRVGNRSNVTNVNALQYLVQELKHFRIYPPLPSTPCTHVDQQCAYVPAYVAVCVMEENIRTHLEQQYIKWVLCIARRLS